jgi:hypothetical protein
MCQAEPISAMSSSLAAVTGAVARRAEQTPIASPSAVNSARVFGVRRGINSGGKAAVVTLGYPESGHQSRELRTLVLMLGRPEPPQKPHNFATRRPIPTGIPRTKRHTPVHLLRVLKVRRTAVLAASMRVSWADGSFSR